ncbi:hypothetical protein Tco_0619838 [Tanacetum coccineum]
MAASGPANIVARRVIDDLIAFSGETDVPNLLSAKDAKCGEEGKLMALNDVIAEAFDEIKTQEENVQVLDAASDGVYGIGWVSFVLVIMFSVRVVF